MGHILKYALFIIAGLLILSFFNISLQSIIESPAGQANINFVWELIKTGAQWIWDLIKPLIDFIIFWD